MRSVDAATRHCEQCRLDVHDLGAMTEAEAHALLREVVGGRVCVRYRSDPRGRIRFTDTDTSGPRIAASALAAAATLVGLVGCISHGPEPLAIDDAVDDPAHVRWLERSVVQPDLRERYVVDAVAIDLEVPPAEPLEWGPTVLDYTELMGGIQYVGDDSLLLTPTRDWAAIVDLMPPHQTDMVLMGTSSRDYSEAKVAAATKVGSRRERRRARRERRRANRG